MANPSRANEHRVAHLSDLVEGEMTGVEAGDRTVLLVRLDGEVHAVAGTCSHYGAPLADGALADGRVICPWHHACFDVRSGAQLEPPGLDALQRYEVRLDGDEVYVSLPDDAPAHRPPPARGRGDDGRCFAVLGGGVAAQHAVETLRAEGFAGRLVMVTREDRWPYDRTKLSKSLAAAEDADALQLRDDAFFLERDIERLGREVVRVDAARRTLHFADGGSLAADALLLAPGSEPHTLDLPGAELAGVHTLRTPADAVRIVTEARAGQRALLVGASFIALELAHALREHHLEVAVVAPDAVPFGKLLGERLGARVQAAHEAQDTRFHLGRTPAAFVAGARGERVGVVRLDDGSELPADLVVVGVGVVPATGMVEGVARTDDGGIVVDASLRAADGVWAAGDAAAFELPRGGGRVRVEHWRVAAQHGRVAARAMLGREVAYEGVPYFWSAQPDLKLRYLGHAGDFDEVIYDGDVDHGAFVAFYLRGGELRAAAAAGRDRELAALEHLVRRGEAPSGEALRRGVSLLERL